MRQRFAVLLFNKVLIILRSGILDTKQLMIKYSSLFLLFSMFLNVATIADDAIKKVVIQVSSNDPVVQKIALNNAANLQKHYGIDNILVEIVAYGPGLSLLTKENKLSPRVESLAVQEIEFKACNNTIKKVTKKKGKRPTLTSGVKITPSGIARIIELQSQGYVYVRP